MNISFGEKSPWVADDVFIAPQAVVVGDVTLGHGCSIWFNSVVRGDINPVRIGSETSIQDGAIIHVGDKEPTFIGDRVVVGHGAQVHGATVEDQCLIGMGAIVLNGAKIGSGAIVAAGAVVCEGTEVPPRTLVAGVPAKVVRPVTDEEFEEIARAAQRYTELSGKYLAASLVEIK